MWQYGGSKETLQGVGVIKVSCLCEYNSQFDNATHLEGVASHEGFFEIALTPYLVTQRANNYAHNDKDRINKEALCMF